MLGACQAAVLRTGLHCRQCTTRQERGCDLAGRTGGGQAHRRAVRYRARVNGLAADECLRIRKEQSAPVLAELETWLREQRSRMSRSASVAGPIDYMLKRWDWVARFI